ncbi:Uncharacterised protein [Mycobacteroides abscessus subsp. abscessus]|nr:Uncharacterised protein [Mycobacteroides abscessus subsp. abscessus]
MLPTVTSSAAAIAAGCACPIATPCPAQVSISTSFGMSPNATVRSQESPARSISLSRPDALCVSGTESSISPLSVEKVTCAMPSTSGRSRRAISPLARSGCRTRSFTTGSE